MSSYLSNNKLKLNDDKTQLLVMATRQRQVKTSTDLEITTTSGFIKPVKTAKLLGIDIQDDLKWSQYILLSDSSLVNN